MKIISIAFFCASFPIFFDISSGNFLLSKIDEIDALFALRPSFPIPLVFISLITFVVIATYRFNLLRSQFYFWGIKELVIITLYFSASLIIYILLDLDFFHILQIHMPLIFFSVMYLIIDIKLLKQITFMYILGVFSWILIHFSSIIVTNNYSFVNVDRDLNFGRFWGYPVYQAWVSYPASLSIQLVFLIFALNNKLFNKYILFFAMALIVAVGFFGKTRLFALDMAVIALLISWLNLFSKKSFNFSSVIKLFIFISPLFFGFIFYGDRILSEKADDRIFLINQAIYNVLTNFDSYFLVGEGGKHSFAHNFFLDFIINYGFLAFILYIIPLYFISKKINKINSIIKLQSIKLGSYILAITFILFQNSIFNSALTQPLVFATYYLVLMLILSYGVSCNYDLQNSSQLNANLSP